MASSIADEAADQAPLGVLARCSPVTPYFCKETQ